MIISKINNMVGPKQNYKMGQNYPTYNVVKYMPCDVVSFGSTEMDAINKSTLEQDFVKQVFDAINIDCEINDNGLLTISEYRQPGKGVTFKDVGLDENILFKYIEKISGKADFRNSSATDLGNLRQINGIADFRDSEIINLGKLKKIKRDAYFKKSKIKDLGELESIRGSASFGNSEVISLGCLQNIGGNADFSGSKIQDTSNLQRIGGNIFYSKSLISNPQRLKYVGKNVYIKDSELTKEDFENVEIKGKIKE